MNCVTKFFFNLRSGCFLLSFLAFYCTAGYSQANDSFVRGAIYLKIQDTSSFQINYPSTSPGTLPIYTVFANYGVTDVRKPFDILPDPEFDRIYRISFTQAGAVDTFINDLAAIPTVEYAEQIPLDRVCAVPNDPLSSYQLPLINAYTAFDFHQGGSLIAVVDNGFLTSHEDLFDNIDFSNSWDVADNDNDVNPPSSGYASDNPGWDHGTKVAGVAGAVTNNNKGVASAGWNNSLMLVKCTKDESVFPASMDAGYEGIAWAAMHGAKVINLSWAANDASITNYKVIRGARAQGAIIVAGAGNLNSALPTFPAAFGEAAGANDSRLVIAVASIDMDKKRSFWGITGTPRRNSASNYGQWVDIAAYGTGILTTSLTPQDLSDIDVYAPENGTSIAAPLVSSVLGLLLSYSPSSSIDDITDCLLSSANDDIYDSQVNPLNPPGSLGSGRLDVLKALQCISNDCSVPPVATISTTTAPLPVFCPNQLGQTIDLSANVGTSYTWSTGATTRNITISQAGSYSVTVSFTGGCTSTASITINQATTTATLIPSEYSGHTWNDGNLCDGDPIDLTAWFGSSYSWSGSHSVFTSPTISATETNITQPVTQTYTVTITGLGGCPGVTGSASFTATWHPLPTPLIEVEEVSQTPNDAIICNGHSATLTGSGGVSYAWGTELDQPAFSTSNPITVFPSQTTTYYLTVTEANGCTSYTSFPLTVEECQPFICSCTESNTINIDASANGTLYSQLEGIFNYDVNDDGILGLADHNGCLAINGKLIIDQDLQILNCPNIRMQPCSEIVVQGHTPTTTARHLTMERNTIYGCQNMWHGITVKPHGYLTFLRNKISDAQYANWIEPSPYPSIPGLSDTRVDIQRNDYERNHVGLFIPGIESGGFLGVVSQTPFIRNHMLGNTTGTNPAPLLEPCDPDLLNYDSDLGYAGAIILGANFNIGSPSNGQILTTFKNLRNGVIASDVLLNVDWTTFEDIEGYDNLGPTHWTASIGVGLGCRNCTVNVHDSQFKIGGHGMHFYNSQVSAQRNFTNRVQRGLEAELCDYLVVSDNNVFNSFDQGILVENLANVPSFSSFIIEDNTLAAQTTQAFSATLSGRIEVNSASLAVPDMASIARNDIQLHGLANGIGMNHQSNWVINDNTVHFNSTPSTATGRGFYLANSEYNYLYDNEVVDNHAPPFGSSTGFYLGASPSNVFCCNSSTGNQSSMLFLGNCDGTDLRHTDMGSHAYSLQIQFSTIIGDQILTHNSFGCNSGQAENLGYDQDIVSSQFYVNGNTCPRYPVFISTPFAGIDPSPLWFFSEEGYDLSCSEDDLCPPPGYYAREENSRYQSDYTRSGDDFRENDLSFAKGLYDNGTLGGACLQWEGARDLYARMKRNPSMRGVTADLDGFFHAVEGVGSVKEFYHADSALAWVQETPEDWGQALIAATDSIEQIEKLVQVKLAELASVSTLADSLGIYWQSEAIRASQAEATATISETHRLMDSLRTHRAFTALPVILNLPEGNTLESNRKTVLRTYLEIIASGAGKLTDEQFDAVATVARQCPLEGGSAVLTARVLFHLNEQEHFNDKELCAVADERQLVNGKLSEGNVRVLPNPSSGSFQVFVPHANVAEPLRIRISDLSGRVIMEQNIVGATLDASSLPTGLYVCYVSTSYQSFSPVKLIITH